jgi:hypothetical protein
VGAPVAAHHEDMHSFATIEFAHSAMADVERHWLYGHPYRAEDRDLAHVGIRAAKRPRRRLAFAGRGRRTARPLAARHA